MFRNKQARLFEPTNHIVERIELATLDWYRHRDSLLDTIQ